MRYVYVFKKFIRLHGVFSETSPNDHHESGVPLSSAHESMISVRLRSRDPKSGWWVPRDYIRYVDCVTARLLVDVD